VGDGVCQIYGKAHRRTNWLCLPHMIIAVAVEQMSWKSVTLKGVQCGTESSVHVNYETEDYES
jgi:hypothetical protein